MKSLFLLFTGLISFSALAECRLINPIPLKGINPLVHPHSTSGVLELRNITLNTRPQSEVMYMRGGQVGAPLALEIFGVLAGRKLSNHLGVNLNPVQASAGYQAMGLGIATYYMFDWMVSGSVTQNGAATIYRTQDLNLEKEKPEHDEPIGISEVEIENDMITRIELTFPVYKLYRNGSYVVAINQGKNETICVLDGQLFVDETPIQ